MNQIETLPGLPSAWIDRLWQRFMLMYGNKFADLWRGMDVEAVKRAWGEDLHGYSGDELRRGLEWCKTQDWPPTLPAFMSACRPVLDAKTEWAEACEQMRIRLEGRGNDRWTRPQVYWAAVSIGAYDLNNASWDSVSARWKAALAVAKSEPIPEYRAALPSPGKHTVTREQSIDKIEAVRGLVDGMAMKETTKEGSKWAYTLMKREAAGETLYGIASKAWREVLGVSYDTDAKAAMTKFQQKGEA